MVKTKPESRKLSTSSARKIGGTANENKMAAAQVNIDSENTENTVCPKCDNGVDDEGIMCDRGCCKSWWHLKCGNITKGEYTAMKSGKRSLMWFCENCIDETEAFIKSTSKIDSKIIVDKLDILTAKVDSLSERVAKLEKAIASEERTMDEVIDMKIEDKFKEMDEKEGRKNNLCSMLKNQTRLYLFCILHKI